MKKSLPKIETPSNEAISPPVTSIPIVIRKRGPTLKKLLRHEVIRFVLLIGLLALVVIGYLIINSNYRTNFEEPIDEIDSLMN
jgi:Trk-type K+ transport system membrane component